ncbi:MAG: LolA family protein [Phycisphaeraceae bacterium]
MRSEFLLWPVVMIVCASMLAGAGASEDAPAEASAEARVSPEVETWLDRIEAKADEIETLRARLKYERVQGLLGDTQIRFGALLYSAGPPSKFAASFDRVVRDRKMRMQAQSFIFDGRWLAERSVDDGRKLFIRRELVPPEREGEDLLGLGEGPFALPLDLEKETVLERFEVTLVEDEPDSDAPENSVHLRLVPREHVDVEQSRIDLWYDRDTLLPVRVRTEEEKEEAVSVITLREIESPAELPEDAFDTTPPRGRGWQVEIKPLEQEGEE